MDPKKRARLEAAGWRFGDYGDFLGLSEAERLLVELRGRIYSAIRELRQRSGLSQAEFAKRLKSSQSRVAKVEAGEPGISLDLLFRAYFALGGRIDDLAPSPKRTRKTPAKRSPAGTRQRRAEQTH